MGDFDGARLYLCKGSISLVLQGYVSHVGNLPGRLFLYMDKIDVWERSPQAWHRLVVWGQIKGEYVVGQLDTKGG